MDLVELKNLDPDLIDEYLIEFSELAHEIFEIEANAQRKLDDYDLKISAEEGVLVKKMTENPKDFDLKKVTNNDVTYALARNSKLFQMKQKRIDLKYEVDSAVALRRTLYVKKEMVLELNKQRIGRMSLETKGNSISDRKQNRH